MTSFSILLAVPVLVGNLHFNLLQCSLDVYRIYFAVDILSGRQPEFEQCCGNCFLLCCPSGPRFTE